MLVCSNVSPRRDRRRRARRRAAARARRARGARGLQIAYEALAWGRHVSEYDHAWRIVAPADHPALGTCLDSFHILSRGTDLDAIDAIPGEKIFFLQLADAPHLTDGRPAVEPPLPLLPRPGRARRRRLRRRACWPPATTARCRSRCSTTSSARPTRTARRSTPCARCSCSRTAAARRPRALDGFAFVEIGVDVGAGDRGRCCARSASRTSARTAPSRCSCGEHGDIRVVLNHGAGDDDPEVVAVAVRARIPDASAARAEALLAPRARAPPRPGRGRPDRGRRARRHRGVLLRPTRLARRLPRDRRARRRPACRSSASTTSRSPSRSRRSTRPGSSTARVLDLQPSESAELAAPDGLVRSRALASRDGRVRIALNVPALAGTQRRQAELQHVAFACARRARRRARDARARRRRCSPIPDNYYDDLAARLELDPTCSTRCASSACSTTAARDGELLHFYTAPLEGRVFFEVLERRGGYDGYGAVNSPVRMAAQRAVATPSARRRDAAHAGRRG